MKKSNIREATKFDDIREIIYNSAKIYSNNIAFVTKITNGKEITYKNTTYKELLEDINSLGISLYKLGLKEQRIAICGRNRYEWALTHLSCLMGNMISIPIDKELQLEELEDSLIRSKAKAIVFDEKYVDKIQEIIKRNKTQIETYICMGNISGFKSINNLINEGKILDKSEYTNCKINNKDMSILLFTSGTTSKSKAVMLSQYGIAVNVYDMQLVEDITSKDTNIAFLPYHHIFGSTAMVVMLACGVKTVFPDGLRYIQSNLNEYKVSLFVGVPLLVDKMYQS